MSFVNIQPGRVALEVRARALAAGTKIPAVASTPTDGSTAGAATRIPSLAASAALVVNDRAFQDHVIAYWLQSPETRAFDISHDYTESRQGIDRYVNVVRGGSRVSKPGATTLDTGQVLPVETLRGELTPGPASTSVVRSAPTVRRS